MRGASIRGLLKALHVFIEDALNGMEFPVRPEGCESDEFPSQSKKRKISVFEQNLPVPIDADYHDVDAKSPYILIQLTTGADELRENGRGEENHIQGVRLQIELYADSPDDGTNMTVHVVDTLRQKFLESGCIDKRYEITDLFEFSFHTDNIYPYYLAEINTAFKIPKVQRSIKNLMENMKW